MDARFHSVVELARLLLHNCYRKIPATGFEPVTFGLGNQRSIQLSYAGASERQRYPRRIERSRRRSTLQKKRGSTCQVLPRALHEFNFATGSVQVQVGIAKVPPLKV